MAEKPSLSEWADERESARFEENQELQRSNRQLRKLAKNAERDLAIARSRLAVYEHPVSYRVEKALAGVDALTRNDVAELLDCSSEEADNVLADLAARGFNVSEDGGIVSKSPPTRRGEIEHFYGDVARFGIISDTHIGNHHSLTDQVHEAYAIFEKEGITEVYAPGNLIDGEKTYRGQEYEISVMGVDNVVTHLANVWPRVPGITTYHVASSTCHEGYYLKSAGVLIGKLIEAERPDMVYLGLDEADIVIHAGERKPRLRIVHPGGGTSYADSYRPQKIVESYAGGDKPTIMAIGHYHKGGYYDIRDVAVVQAACLERQTPFMRKRSLRAVLGFWIIEAHFTESGSLRRVKPEFFKYYLDEGGKVLHDW